jgi:hypothetical protein
MRVKVVLLVLVLLLLQLLLLWMLYRYSRSSSWKPCTYSYLSSSRACHHGEPCNAIAEPHQLTINQAMKLKHTHANTCHSSTQLNHTVVNEGPEASSEKPLTGSIQWHSTQHPLKPPMMCLSTGWYKKPARARQYNTLRPMPTLSRSVSNNIKVSRCYHNNDHQ